MWEDDETDEEVRLMVRTEGDGGEIEEAEEWYRRVVREEEEAWNEEVVEEQRVHELRRLAAVKAAQEREKLAALAALDRSTRDEQMASVRRKEQEKKNREYALELQRRMGKESRSADSHALASAPLTSAMSVTDARTAAAAAARANPLPPKRIEAMPQSVAYGAKRAAAAVGQTAAQTAAQPAGQPPLQAEGEAGAAEEVEVAVATASLSKSCYWFEDCGASIKICVPLAQVGPGSMLVGCW